MPRMPLCGGLSIGVDRSEPKIPPLVSVNVPPESSSSVSFPSRARVASRSISRSISANESRWASWTTGTTRPRSVATERGLVVPVVHDAHRLSFAEIEREIERLATRAREGKLTLEELSGGTFTLTNGGIFGSLLSTPILNPPQSGILGMHKIEKRPVVVDDQIVVRPMMYVALSYDHRLVDGEQAVTFLVRVKAGIEDPSRLLLEV